MKSSLTSVISAKIGHVMQGCDHDPDYLVPSVFGPDMRTPAYTQRSIVVRPNFQKPICRGQAIINTRRRPPKEFHLGAPLRPHDIGDPVEVTRRVNILEEAWSRVKGKDVMDKSECRLSSLEPKLRVQVAEPSRRPLTESAQQLVMLPVMQ